MIRGWHITSKDRSLRYDLAHVSVEQGSVIKLEPDTLLGGRNGFELGMHGLHMATNLISALTIDNIGANVCMVEMPRVFEFNDYLQTYVGDERRVLEIFDITEILPDWIYRVTSAYARDAKRYEKLREPYWLSTDDTAQKLLNAIAFYRSDTDFGLDKSMTNLQNQRFSQAFRDFTYAYGVATMPKYISPRNGRYDRSIIAAHLEFYVYVKTGFKLARDLSDFDVLESGEIFRRYIGAI